MAQDFTNPQLEIRGVVKQKRRWPVVVGVSAGVLAVALAGSGWACPTRWWETTMSEARLPMN